MVGSLSLLKISHQEASSLRRLDFRMVMGQLTVWLVLNFDNSWSKPNLLTSLLLPLAHSYTSVFNQTGQDLVLDSVLVQIASVNLMSACHLIGSKGLSSKGVIKYWKVYMGQGVIN